MEEKQLWWKRSVSDPLTEQDEEFSEELQDSFPCRALREKDEGLMQIDQSEKQVQDSSPTSSSPPSANTNLSTSISLPGSSTGSPRIPAAGLGTRVGPRPIPKSSSSLRHIFSKGRTVSFGTPMPEHRDPSEPFPTNEQDNRSSVEKTFLAVQRRERERIERESVMESDEDEDDVNGIGRHIGGLDLESSTAYTSSSDSAKMQRNNLREEVMGRDVHSLSPTDTLTQVGVKGALGLSSSDESESDEYDEEGGLDQRNQSETPDVQITSHDSFSNQPKLASSSSSSNMPTKSTLLGKKPNQRRGLRFHDEDSPPLLSVPNGLQTPGPSFPQDLHTPLGTPPELSLDSSITPQERLEWHAMLQSTLRSEVLKSETKRIISADAPNSTPSMIMYQRWLDIRASLRGRGNQKGAIEMEEKRVNEGWPILMKKVIDEVKSCRSNHSNEFLDDLIAADEEKEKILEEIEGVLQSVDNAEEQFPSIRKILETIPEWGEEEFQYKLDSLYSWYNVTTSLMLQIKILQEWTGSLSLDVLSTHRLQSNNEANQEGQENEPHAFRRKDLEEGTFLERILKENSLQSTFEKRTLRTLSQLIMKAKHAIIHHHVAFSKMALPSFEPELVQLINFPTRLMEGALRVRLDYVGKLQDPSVLIVDSLIDDLRAAIALACRIKLQYSAMMVPQPERGWDLPPCIGTNYDAVLREALQYFFKLLNYKLKGSLFFKETEILEPEWRFLSTAVEVIEGADILVACSITKIVNKLFIRIVKYFERELSAPRTRNYGKNDEDERSTRMSIAPINVSQNAARGPPVVGGLTKGNVKMPLDEKVRWIKQVFDSVRIRSRKLLGFARDIRNRLENASEYDLSSLRSPVDASTSSTRSSVDATANTATGKETSIDAISSKLASRTGIESSSNSTKMDLTEFLQTLINAGYFLVLTGSFEAEGTYLIAEPSLHDKPELIQKLFTKCLHRVRQHDEDSFLTASAIIEELARKEKSKRQKSTPVTTFQDDTANKEEDSDNGDAKEKDDDQSKEKEEEEPPRYLLILTPRDAFMWTGKVMMLAMERIDVNLKDRRLRLIADGPERRLELCKKHLYNVFGADYATASVQQEDEDNAEDHRLQRSRRRPSVIKNGTAFPLEIVDESLAHMSTVQAELRRINKGVYILSDSINRSVPKIRRNMRGRRKEEMLRTSETVDDKPLSGNDPSNSNTYKGGDCDDLIQNCFAMAAEQGFRAMPFIESARLRGQMTLALASLAIDWVAFICDDCEPSDRRTFKFAVAALENAMRITQSDYIFDISEEDFMLMRSKVASCVGLLISHFDILGARSSVAKAKEEEERLEKEKAERARAIEMAAGLGDLDSRSIAAKLIEGSGGTGAPPMLDRADSGMQATEERWVQKVMEWDSARQSIEAEQRLIGRVLDDTRLEDQGLQFLASSTSRIQIRWQQGRFIGGGTFGTVYLAVNLDSGGLMAVKEIRFQDISSTPSMYKQIKDEMSVMEMLSHPNIVEYYGIEVHRDKVYIFEEYCQGGSLAQLLEHGRIEDEMVMQVYTLQMLDGLVYLHSKGVVHRDIKPDNILLDHMGVIKFVDFGAAKVLAKNSRTIQRSRRPGMVGTQAITGMLGPDGKPAAATSLQGTPMYMSPEVIKGESRGRRGAMDVWSLGCVVLEFATGKRPWSQLDNEWAIMFHIGMAQQHPPLPEPGQLSELGIDFIRNCLVIDPYDRPSAAEMREHAWIKNLVEALNEANAEEAAAAATMESTPGVGGGGSSEGRTGSESGHGIGSEGGSFSSGQLSSFNHNENSAAGVAAMVATPGTRSINGFNFTRPIVRTMNSSTSSFSRSSIESPYPSAIASIGPTSKFNLATPSTAATTEIGSSNLLSEELSSATNKNKNNDYDAKQSFFDQSQIHHQPGYPNHQHPGSEALIADLAYRREEEETRRMKSSD